MRTIAIQGSDLCVTYGSRLVLDHVDITLCCGEVAALLGPNGAGKSTLLKLLSGEMASTGSLRYFDRPSEQWPAEKLARHLGILPQQSTLSFPFTAQEVVELGAIPLRLPRKEVECVARYYMQKTDVLHLASSLYPSLSGGEKQRLHLARVLTQLHQAGKQRILMLDEPTSALDLAHQHNTLQLARQLANEEECAVVVVLHDLNLAAQYADRMILLHQGKIVCDATPWQALTAERIEQVYGYQALIAAHPTRDFPMVYPT
ncbi:heme ABC transporter ATP-binding protein [Vibrio mimicus]|uniref:heme ABC transporter ATP-binding protein n=1 Tax=Vibrio mimicus TaxID=674 RepID=UPI0001BAD39D|nr:heme ABC transporter ATP-binding protein [Vibrio mimicus]EEY45508.1 ABC-type hemin transport system ATPase component [Vibrio mimicus VM223]